MSRGLGGTWAGAVVVGCITAIVLTIDRLPTRVASHFGADGLANGFSTRLQYAVLTVGLTSIVALAPAALIGMLARRWPNRMNLPNTDYWLAPERRAATIRFLDQFANWFAAGLASFMLALHFLVVRANVTTPPRLEYWPFVGLVIAFGVLLIVWIGTLHHRFRRPG